MVRDYNAPQIPHVHKEHFNAQVTIQKVVRDSHTGKDSVEVVRINLTSDEVDKAMPSDLTRVLQNTIAHLMVASGQQVTMGDD